MRKLIVLLGLVALLALGAQAAGAKTLPGPDVLCGASCDGGGTHGWSGCTQVTSSESQGVRWIAYVRHYLVVNYCKSNGVITSLSIAAHGCDYEGAAFCSAGPAWQTSGGVGVGWASVTGHATYVGTLANIPFAGTSVVNVDVPLG